MIPQKKGFSNPFHATNFEKIQKDFTLKIQKDTTLKIQKDSTQKSFLTQFMLVIIFYL